MGVYMTENEIKHVIGDIVNRIASQFHPQKILLFGSHATGLASEDSDVDLLIVMDVPGSKRQKAVDIDIALQGVPVPTDIIVVTPEDMELGSHYSDTVIYDALTQGRVLYEQAA